MIQWISRNSNGEAHNIAQGCSIQRTDWPETPDIACKRLFGLCRHNRRIYAFTDAARDEEGYTSVGVVLTLTHLVPAPCSSLRIGFAHLQTDSAEETETIVINKAMTLIQIWDQGPLT